MHTWTPYAFGVHFAQSYVALLGNYYSSHAVVHIRWNVGMDR